MIDEVLKFGKGLRIPLLINVVYSVVLKIQNNNWLCLMNLYIIIQGEDIVNGR